MKECEGEGTAPKDSYAIHFSIPVVPDLKKGNTLKGEVHGFRAVFNRGDSYPTIYFHGKKIQWDQRKSCAIKALRAKAEELSSKQNPRETPAFEADPIARMIKSAEDGEGSLAGIR